MDHEAFIAKWLLESRDAFPDPAVRRAIAETAWREHNGVIVPDEYDALHTACCKGVGDVRGVQAIIDLLVPGLEEWWRETLGEATDDAVGRFMELEDRFPSSRPDGLDASEEPQRDEALLLLGFLSVLERGAQRPLTGRLDALLTRSATKALRVGDSAIDLSREPLLRAAAKDDLRAMLAGRILLRRDEIRDHATDFLRSQRARRGAAPGDITPSFSGGAGSLQEWLAGQARLSGLDTSRWLPQVVDQWAYRWFNVGAFRGARQRGVSDFVAFAVRDSRTTPFCIWVHGRPIAVGKAQRQLDRHIRFSTQGDIEGMARNWPMLDRDIIQGAPTDFRRGFRRVGIPPYHFGCRTRIRPA